jgi:hypothetical protein
VFKRIIWYLFLLVGIAVSIYTYREYNRKPADLLDSKPAFTVAAAELVREFETDEAAANKKYLNKIIQVSGPISSLSSQQDTAIIVAIGDENQQVGCVLNKKYAAIIGRYKISSLIKIKGICTGYLMDVELNRCVIVE